jgi:cellulose synthase/poly-beta-1,6-N-acetylglucosamine synthase-like glycosyltransferase
MEILLSTGSFFLTLAYAVLLLLYRHGWRTLPGWDIPGGWSPAARISVVIAARNEAARIGACLRSIMEGTYPPDLLEIIVVDDFSEDGTAGAVQRLSREWKIAGIDAPGIWVLQLADALQPGEPLASHKKKAIEWGIAHAGGDLIVTTDADCIAPADWLRLIASYFDRHPDAAIVAGPVAFHHERNWLQRFQSLDFLGLMGITGAGIRLGRQRMGNGANLAYPKAIFEAVGGFDGNAGRASGDDMFLIQKVAARWPGGVFFLKNRAATVLTEAEADWRAFFRQRLRWGTKNAALPEWPVRLVLLAVFLFCWSIWINAGRVVLGVPASGSIHPAVVLSLQLAVKATADFFFLRGMCRFFKREDLLRSFVPSFFLHTLYIPLVGTASLFFKKYEWKGRKVS